MIVILAAALLCAQEGRAPLPPDADVKTTELTIRDLYKDQYRAKDPAGRRQLAQALLSRAAESRGEPAIRYVLLKEARDAAMQAAEWALALRITDELAQSFAVDGGVLRMAVVERITKTPIDSPAAAKAAAEVCLSAAEQLVAADDYDRALKALQGADGPSRVSKETLLPLLVKSRAAEVALIKTEYAKARAAEKTLQDSPQDAAAALALGKFYCYAKHEWIRGLPFLARGSDSKLVYVATQELSNPTGTALEAGIGNAWWALADEQPAPLRPGIRDHALQWFGRAWPKADPELKTALREKMKATWSRPGGKGVAAKGAAAIPPPWGLMGTIPTVLEESPAHSGMNSVRVGGLSSLKFPAKPGDEFFLSGWVLSENNENAADCFRLDFFGADGKWFGADGPDAPVDRPMWTPLSKLVTCPANTTAVAFVSFRSRAIGSFWVDDISLRKVGDDRELIKNGSFEDR